MYLDFNELSGAVHVPPVLIKNWLPRGGSPEIRVSTYVITPSVFVTNWSNVPSDPIPNDDGPGM